MLQRGSTKQDTLTTKGSGKVEAIRQIDLEVSTGGRNESTALSKRSGEPTRRMQIRKWLVTLGMARREAMGDAELLLYSKALERFADAPIQRVIERLSLSPRSEFESKIPELGDLVKMVRTEALRADRPRNCAVCANSRWVIAKQGGEPVAKRCQCLIEWKQRQSLQ
jgi:hypothetical protein